MTAWATKKGGYVPTTDFALVATDGRRYGTLPADRSLRIVLASASHGATGSIVGPVAATFAYYQHVTALVHTGRYLVCGIDAAGGVAWSNDSALTAMTNARAWLRTLTNSPVKIGLMSYSMGGLLALNWIKRNPTLVAGAQMFAPVTDLDWAHGANPGYGILAPGSWAGEIETAFGTNAAGYAAATAGYRVMDEPASWRGICPIKIAHGASDAAVPPAASAQFVSLVNDPQVTLRPNTTGHHTTVFGSVPVDETVRFFDSLNWG